MLKGRKIIHGIVLTVLLICTVCILCSIVNDPFNTNILVPALATTGGFYLLGNDIRKK